MNIQKKSQSRQLPPVRGRAEAAEMANNVLQGSIPKIDLTGIDQAAGPGDARWTTVRAAVMDTLVEHGCFEAVMDGLITPELSAAILGPGGAVESLVALPVSAKARNTSELPYHGYVGSIPGLPYETLNIADALCPHAVRGFADLMWLDTGNKTFCESMQAYVDKLAVLEALVRRMVLESAGATAESMEEQAKATSFELRLSEYLAPGTADGRLGLPTHRDTSILGVLTQNDIDAVELECARGEGGWTRPALSPGSFLIFAGDMLRVLTNGRVYNPLHRVVMTGDKTRYSSILFSNPKEDAIVRPIEEAVDAEHPAIYRPFKYAEYVFFYFDPETYKSPNKLEAFAAVRVDG